MKKIFIAIAAVTAMTFASCGGSSNGNDNDADTLAIEEPDTTIKITDELETAIENGDKDAVNAAIEALKEKIVEVANDSLELAKYKYQLQKFAADHKADLEKLTSGELTVTDIIENAQNASSLVSGLKEAVKADANTVNDEAKAKAEETKEAVKEAAKAKAEEAANEAANKANEAANKAINDAADALKKKLGK